MNNRVSKLFACCLGNRVVIIDTNFKDFHTALKKFEPSCKSNKWFELKFKEVSEFSQIIDGKEYYFQRLV